MKRFTQKIGAIAFSLLFAIGVSFTGCRLETEGGEPALKNCTVVVLNNPLCAGLGIPQKVKRGEDAVFTFQVKKGYTFESVNYKNYEVSVSDPAPNGERTVTLTLHAVKYTESLEVKIKEALRTHKSEITYHLNGGAFLRESEGSSFQVSYDLQKHYRPNTEKGTDTMKRDGFVQIGWNTKADGSGTHVGLGSKAPVYDGGHLDLYAQWASYAEEQSFEYILIEKEEKKLYNYYIGTAKFEDLQLSQDEENCVAIIQNYIGDDSQLVIPEYIDGHEVVAINTGAVKNKDKISSIVLPKSIRSVEDLAFENCSNIKELYLYDNLLRLENDAFGNPFTITTLHINAIRPPIYGKQEAMQVANKLEMLRNHDGVKPKIVIFGSCSTFYGISAAKMQEAFPAYDVFNMGVIGGINAFYQIELIKSSLKEGDVFLQVLELGSKYQLLMSRDFAANAFATLENNYDYLAELNMQDYQKVVSSLELYFIGKNNSSTGHYTDFLTTMSAVGDLLKEREGGYENQGIPYDALSVEEITQSSAFEEMKILFDELVSIGVKSYCGFGPMNSDGLEIERIQAIERLFKEQFISHEIPLVILNEVFDGIMDKKYFTDANYHLTMEGAELLTQSFIQGLSPFYEADTLSEKKK